ncbi:MAG: heme-binding protein [Hyphomicrobiaceae bacterium]
MSLKLDHRIFFSLSRPCRSRLAIGLVSLAAVASMAPSSVTAREATFVVKQLTTETALKAAQAALETCRMQGFQVAVAVTDRSGIPQALLRDSFAGPHTVDVAINKAWTSVSFRTDTESLTAATAKPENLGARHIDRVVAIGGGVPITAAGSIFGAIGVSGSATGEDDDKCARFGIEAIISELGF